MNARDRFANLGYEIIENRSYIHLEKHSDHEILIFKAVPETVNIKPVNKKDKYIRLESEAAIALGELCKELNEHCL